MSRLTSKQLCLGALLLCGAWASFAETPEATGLAYLNGLRASTGMTTLRSNTLLDTAAANHSLYSFLNNVTGHYQDPIDPGFTGVRPADRTEAAGYLSALVSENVAYGDATVSGAIDNLMSAIYHRFGFLSPTITEIGIGIQDVFYTFDMGNSALNALCEGTSFSGFGSFYIDVCADAVFRIASVDFDGAVQATAESNPTVILWPPENGIDVPPVFYEEIPDPLPAHGVTGYPVSVQFNEHRVGGSVEVQGFSVRDSDGFELPSAHKVLNPGDDVNNKFSDYEAAVFPLPRLEWGARYRAQLEYMIDGGSTQTLQWQFTTRGLPHPFYRIEDELAAELPVVSGRSYSVYLVPQDTNDRLSGYEYSYATGMTIDAAFLDKNTINVTITGTLGQEMVITLSNGLQITLVVAANDTAQDNTVVYDSDGDGRDDEVDNCPSEANPDQQDTDTDGQGDVCDADDDADGLSDEDETTVHGTDPLKSDTDADGIDDLYEVTAGLNPNVDDAAEDKDDDGVSNLEEYTSGTDPNDPDDPLSARGIKALQTILPLLLEE